MHFLKYYYENIVKYDLINKFQYKKIKKLPKLKKIILNFRCTNFNITNLAAILLSLKLITNQQTPILTVSKKSNIILKIRKGNPIGYKIILKKTAMYIFFSKLLYEIFPQLKNFVNFNLQKKKLKDKTISYNLKNCLLFSELKKNYYLFNKLPPLNITFIINNNINKKEFLFLLKSFKLPIITSSFILFK